MKLAFVSSFLYLLRSHNVLKAAKSIRGRLFFGGEYHAMI